MKANGKELIEFRPAEPQNSGQMEKDEYLTDGELDQLIAEIEAAPLLRAPSYLKTEVLEKFQKKEDINHRAGMRLKTWQIITVVAAALLFLVMPGDWKPENTGTFGFGVGAARQERIWQEKTAAEKSLQEKKQDRIRNSTDVVGEWMYTKNREVGAAIRSATDQLLPDFLEERSR